ncbi:probable tyrosyl-DNA phosphodiesterase isoform X2 [Monomorium pharaonis]|uniref:probable tyrosyl-DNA phosphodiesterase isoform X2 n=1 Tax=Monomorium pharaonis TaxID=307658 RepID=UPI00102E1C34|nr:probable tyrosyl-DNA phosphodiesterase isoform X2 [Monomorium pharaonis]
MFVTSSIDSDILTKSFVALNIEYWMIITFIERCYLQKLELDICAIENRRFLYNLLCSLSFTTMNSIVEELLIDQLDGAIEIPEVLHFTCDDRAQLLDQLKVLQMVLRKQRDNKSRSNQLSVISSSSSKTECTSTATSNTKDDLKEKIERHKKATALRRHDKLKQMDTEAQALSRALAGEECDSSKSVKTKKRNQEASEAGSSVTKKMRQMSIESSSRTKDSQQSISDSSSSTSNERNSRSGTSIMDMYQACGSEMSRNEIRKKAIKMMRQSGYGVSVVEPGEFAIKYAFSAPYHLFYTRVENSHETYNQQFSITFPEILDRSLGEIVNSLHLNFMVDVGWLCLQYLLAGQRTDMMILYGERVDHEKLHSNITMIEVELPTKFGCHHSKVMILQYKDDGIRVVISTANLYSDDWENRTQGLWISPHLPRLPESANPSDGESPTGFKKDLERYLSKYRLPDLTQWICIVRRADFSDVKVFLVASVPGTHKDNESDFWGHKKLGFVLSRHATLPPDAPQWPIIAQSSSIGSLGPNFESWLSKDIIPCMSRETTKGLKSHPHFQFIYPSIQNYKESFDCRNLSCCLPYSTKVHSKQQWVESYLYQWKARRTGRERAMPHIKSYTRISPDLKRIPWFVLTSANLSKAAWGVQRNNHYIMSYEAGIIFIPKFITGTTTFPIEDEEDPAVPVFPIPYDLPLCRYESGDRPFVCEFLSSLGRI